VEEAVTEKIPCDQFLAVRDQPVAREKTDRAGNFALSLILRSISSANAFRSFS